MVTRQGPAPGEARVRPEPRPVRSHRGSGAGLPRTALLLSGSLILTACASGASTGTEMGEGGPGASQELTSVRECVDAPVAVAVPRGLTSAERASWFAAEGIDLGSAAYRFVEEPRPVVSNRVEVARRLLEAYPAVLRDRKVEGRVDVGLLVSAAGRVDRAVIVRSAGSGVLDEAALDVARIIRFRPLVLAGCRVAFWIGLPIAFGTR